MRHSKHNNNLSMIYMLTRGKIQSHECESKNESAKNIDREMNEKEKARENWLPFHWQNYFQDEKNEWCIFPCVSFVIGFIFFYFAFLFECYFLGVFFSCKLHLLMLLGNFLCHFRWLQKYCGFFSWHSVSFFLVRCLCLRHRKEE